VKKSTLVILSVAALAGMSSLANATPTGVENFISGGGAGISDIAKNSGGTTVAQNAQNIGPNVNQATGQNGGISQLQSVPELGTVLLLGIGLLGLALWQLRSRKGFAS
jgi:hypothetical protein